MYNLEVALITFSFSKEISRVAVKEHENFLGKL